MTQSKIEWMQIKAEQMLHGQIEQIARSQCPAGDLAEGMIEMAYGLGLADDASHAYWHQAIGQAVCGRRQELSNLKCRELLGPPVMVNGELFAGEISS